MRKRLKIDTLDHRWHDRDQIMLHAAFQTLVDFMEKEEPKGLVDWAGTGPEALAAWIEMNLLYLWWKYRDHDAWWQDMDGKVYEYEQAMFRRLVEVRGFMWT